MEATSPENLAAIAAELSDDIEHGELAKKLGQDDDEDER